jgi:hypothetical protein
VCSPEIFAGKSLQQFAADCLHLRWLLIVPPPEEGPGQRGERRGCARFSALARELPRQRGIPEVREDALGERSVADIDADFKHVRYRSCGNDFDRPPQCGVVGGQRGQPEVEKVLQRHEQIL